ncbi:MAG: hypothetical protein U9N49_04975 [Campylobacterota bacterium]|nr:hypothetical protein [Campylobacterota bacterium]
MRFLMFFILSISLFANVDATIRIEKDVDQRSKIALIDDSSALEPYLASKFFNLLQDFLLQWVFALDSLLSHKKMTFCIQDMSTYKS